MSLVRIGNRQLTVALETLGAELFSLRTPDGAEWLWQGDPKYWEGRAPILLLDEIAAHLDPLRRAALFAEIVALSGQTWMTGTDPEGFSALAGRARFHRVEEGRIAPFAGPAASA